VNGLKIAKASPVFQLSFIDNTGMTAVNNIFNQTTSNRAFA